MKNLIGISGKIGSGKDTLGNIINWIIWKQKFHSDDTEIKYHPAWYRKESDNCGFEIKKFAAKLKQTVVLLTGCKIENLENQEFKNSNLPSEWNRIDYNFKKEKSFELATQFGYIFDEKIAPTIRQQHKEAALNLARLNGWYQANTASSDEWLCKIKCGETPMTYREILQKVGTEAMRNQIHENSWVNALFADYKGVFRGGGLSDDDLTEDYPKWIITDCRFPNEAEAIKKHGGIIIRIERFNPNPVDTHASETSLDHYPFDYKIDNNGTIEGLIIKVNEFLKMEKII